MSKDSEYIFRPSRVVPVTRGCRENLGTLNSRVLVRLLRKGMCVCVCMWKVPGRKGKFGLMIWPLSIAILISSSIWKGTGWNSKPWREGNNLLVMHESSTRTENDFFSQIRIRTESSLHGWLWMADSLPSHERDPLPSKMIIDKGECVELGKLDMRSSREWYGNSEPSEWVGKAIGS